MDSLCRTLAEASYLSFLASVLRDNMIACSQAYLFGVSGKNIVGKSLFFLTPFFPRDSPEKEACELASILVFSETFHVTVL